MQKGNESQDFLSSFFMRRYTPRSSKNCLHRQHKVAVSFFLFSFSLLLILIRKANLSGKEKHQKQSKIEIKTLLCQNLLLLVNIYKLCNQPAITYIWRQDNQTAQYMDRSQSAHRVYLNSPTARDRFLLSDTFWFSVSLDTFALCERE